MAPMQTHGSDARELDIPYDAKTFSVSFAGYDREKGHDDLVYISINTYWEDVLITLPALPHGGVWYLCVNTSGDGLGRCFYPQGQEVRVDGSFILRARSVAVFTVMDC